MSNSPAQVFAAELMAQLVSRGVTRVFVAPGARSQALAVAASQLATAGHIELVVRLDERSLGFTALGAALSHNEPAVIITTSGTAVANLHPAVLEASHSGVPLIVLSADRPHELRGVGANQTANQVGIFADAVRECFDIAAPVAEGASSIAAEQDPNGPDFYAARAIELAMGSHPGTRPGPVQLNIGFREPLSSNEPRAHKILEQLERHPLSGRAVSQLDTAVFDTDAETVIIAGAGAGRAARELSDKSGWPLMAEPSSGARSGSQLVPRYAELLLASSGPVNQVRRAIVYGKPTLSRSVIRLLANPDVQVIVVRDAANGHFDVTRRASQFVDHVSVRGEKHTRWLDAWLEAGAALHEPPVGRHGLNRKQIVEAVWRATEPNDQLLLGASELIRVADRFAPAAELRIFSNRGLAGIDGTVATAIGLALAEPGVTTRALIGDLTLLHDVGSLNLSDLPRLNVQLVVGNDNGGQIFENLEIATVIERPDFERLFKTPQSMDFAKLAGAFGWQHVRASSPEQLDQVLKLHGFVLIEIAL